VEADLSFSVGRCTSPWAERSRPDLIDLVTDMNS
jgi:hypothetical protein